MIVQKIIYIFFSYLIGSILFAEVFVNILKKESLFEISHNHNPGVSNAFKYGGPICGSFAVIGDLAKGIIPVILYPSFFDERDFGIAIVMLAVAIGHAYSIFYKFRGGMCIAVSFGMLIGLWPDYMLLATLVITFLLLLATRKMSNSVVSICAYCVLIGMTIVYMALRLLERPVGIGTILVSMLVCFRMRYDVEEED